MNPDEADYRLPKWLRIILPLIVLSVLVGVVQFMPQGESLIDHVQSWGTAAPLIFVLGSALMMSLMTPKTVVSLTAGALFGTVMGSAVMLVTAVLAAALNYVIGKWYLAESMQRKLQTIRDQEHLGRSQLLPLAHSIAKDGGFGLHLLIRLCPVPTFVVSYTMGACGARWRPFLAAAAVGVVPQWLWVHSGTAARNVGKSDTSGLIWVSIVLSLIGGIAISIVVPRLAMKRLRENQTASESSKLRNQLH